jgi:hypothetical protein
MVNEQTRWASSGASPRLRVASRERFAFDAGLDERVEEADALGSGGPERRVYFTPCTRLRAGLL